MIQLNELRLGNWVCDSKFSQFPMQVVNLGTDYVYLDFEGNEGDVWEPDIKEMCGVPLTEELILKCGFVKADCFYYTYRCPFTLWYDNFNNGSYNALSGTNHIAREIKYIHQLQNLYFALTGEELKIKL